MESTHSIFNNNTWHHPPDPSPQSGMEFVDKPFCDTPSQSPSSLPVILVVDDERHVCNIIEEYFTILGYRVITALNGESGLRRFRDSSPAIVITDLDISDCSGLDIARQMKLSAPSITIILITGYPLESLDMGDCAGLIDHTLQKPVDFAALAGFVGAITGR